MNAGPIVNELSTSFDLFWNSEWALPVGCGRGRARDRTGFAGLSGNGLRKNSLPPAIPIPSTNISRAFARVWSRSGTHSSGPRPKFSSSIRPGLPRNADNVIALALRQRANEVERELLIESPYFVLGDPTIERVRQLTARGVKVRVLTNSAASHDVLPALAGYVNTRKKLLNAGIELYELRADSDMPRIWSVLAGKSRAALHSKSLVFDRKSVFIGSFNLDPRSTALNTEIGVMIDSPEIAGRVGELMDEGISPGSAFHVTLDKNDNLVWTAENNEEKVEYDKDPETSFWHRFVVGVVGMLPIEDQL